LAQHSRHKQNGKKFVAIGVAVVGILLVFGLLYFSTKKFEEEFSPVSTDDADGVVTHTTDPVSEDADERVFINGKWYEYKNDMETTLLMGLDDFGEIRPNDLYENTAVCDFLMLLVKNDTRRETFAIQINRDTITDVNVFTIDGTPAGRDKMQIALAHTFGTGGADSCENTVDAASYFLYSIPIQNYIAMTMDGVGILNDEVGGVSLKSLDDFPKEGWKKDEMITLEGDEALTYVRGRKGIGDETNVSRQERQRQYILAWADVAKDKMKSTRAATKLIEGVSPYMCTNCDATKLAAMAEDMAEYQEAPIYVPEGEIVEGEKYIEFYADEDALRDLIIDLFYEEIKEDNK